MEVKINIEPNLSEDYLEFHVREMTDEMSKLVSTIQNTNSRFIASKGEMKYTIDFGRVQTVYSENKKITIMTDDKQTYFINGSIKELSSSLPFVFLRISGSEIINTKKISHFEFTFGGKLKIYFQNGSFTYSSRAYLKEIRRYFKL